MKRLYVGNLPYQATEVELQEWFQQAGINVESVNIMKDRLSGEARGFGFVDVPDDEEAERAVNSCNGQNFQGRNLVVNEARPAPNRPPSRSFGRGRRDNVEHG